MSFVRWLDEIRQGDKTWAGAKAESLGELIQAGCEVPRGFCITADAYRDAFAENQINEKISARLASIEISDPMALEPAAEEIRSWIETVPMDSGVTQEIEAAMGRLGNVFAVRASRVVEDVPNPSASGLRQAYLGVPREHVLDYVRKCWATPWTSRAIYFRHRKKIGPEQVAMGVVVQPMIEAEAAGVLFTANPLSGDGNEIHIDATWGLGEAITAARWKPDHFVVEKSSRVIRERAVASKSVMNIVAPEGGLQTLGVPSDKQERASLSDAQIIRLAELGQRVEVHFKGLQDIEWCCVGDKIFLLQTRPLRR